MKTTENKVKLYKHHKMSILCHRRQFREPRSVLFYEPGYKNSFEASANQHQFTHVIYRRIRSVIDIK